MKLLLCPTTKTKRNKQTNKQTNKNDVYNDMRLSVRLTNWKRWLKIAVSRLYRGRLKCRLTWWTGPTTRPCGTKWSTAPSTSKRTGISTKKSLPLRPGRFSFVCIPRPSSLDPRSSSLSLSVCASFFVPSRPPPRIWNDQMNWLEMLGKKWVLRPVLDGENYW